MFGGTGAFRNHLCPHIKSSAKSSTVLPIPSTCGRPHCKYSHSTDLFTEQQNGLSSSPPITSKRLLFPEGENFALEDHSTSVESSVIPVGGENSLIGEEAVRGAVDAISVAAPIHNGGPAAVSQLEESILALQRSGIAGLLGKPVNGDILPLPTYSDAPPQPHDHNPYFSAWDEPPRTTQLNDLEYDPVSNWKVPFRSAAATDTEADSSNPFESPSDENIPSSSGLSITLPALCIPGSNSASSNRARFINHNPIINTANVKIPGKDSFCGTNNAQRSAAAVAKGAAGPVPPTQARRKAGSPAADPVKPVKKKARFGRSDEDEEEMPVVSSAKTVKNEVGPSKAEVIRRLFGDDEDDEDDDEVMVELPIEMPKKNPTPGFPKNPQKLLQNMSASSEAAKAAPSKTSDAPPRPVGPPRKKVASAQLQLEMRMKAIDELRKQQPSAQAAAAAAAAASGSGLVSVAAVDKGGKRVAHQPKPATLKTAAASQVPRVAAVHGSKLSLPFRQQVLEKFIQHMSPIYKNEAEAVERAVQTEREIAQVSFHMVTYRNKATQELVKLKNAVAPSPTPAVGVAAVQKDKPMVFPKVQPVAPQVQKQNFSVLPKKTQQRVISNDPMLWSEQDFYMAIKKHLVTEDGLVLNGYPLIESKKQDGENRRDGLQLYIAMSGKITSDRITQTRRTCCRCKKEFTVDFEGNYAREEECLYHWGKAFSRRVTGEGIAAKRTCCSDESSSRGCCVAKFHVADTIPSLSSFVSTKGVKPVKPEDRWKVYAIDCEMIYTVGGLELARVTVVDRSLNCVYESLVKPKQRIVDCNTRFSGLKPENFNKELGRGIKTIEDVHADLLGGLINEDTILLGHSLESDLLAMKLIHGNIVDTSLVFPHKNPEYKRALRNLMRELLQKVIQEDVGGHDSREDASACMELMLWKLKQDRNRRV